MNAPLSLVIFIDILGSVLMLLVSCWCAVYARRLLRNKPIDIFRNHIFLFTLVILFFAVSRSFGHLVKQMLLLNDLESLWSQIAPFSGAINSTTFVFIFALSIAFDRFQKVHSELEHYRDNLEKMIKERTTELESSKNTLENILNNSNPINITGINFDLLQANDAYYSLWPKGRDKGEVIKCYESRPGEHCHTAECPLKLITDGSMEVIHEVSKKLSGKTMNFIVTARPFRDVEGKLIGMVESFQDITQRTAAELVLIKMDQMKSELISTAAHELNTPLSAIMGYTELLITPEFSKNMSAQQKLDCLHEIYDRGEALSRIIDNLLDIGRIDSGLPVSLDLHETDFMAALNKSIDFFRFQDKLHTYTLDLPDEPAESKIMIDRHRINQVLENLLSNAMKYSPKGTAINLKGRLTEKGWEVRVEDRGIGMTQEQLDRIYDKFYRADSSDTTISGLGLGMSVAKQIVEAHKGKIRVESIPGEGTTVIFTLPFSTS